MRLALANAGNKGAHCASRGGCIVHHQIVMLCGIGIAAVHLIAGLFQHGQQFVPDKFKFANI
ncbi:MAG: hypothetical protein COW19_07540 [Zetaproteobacteria bacterium CG12_big_fil_rev_8_21_14_0_65_55_1124]|nr:MAG: hypothetical protein COT53_03255 [Zetaproteobacteria bacterium CG08_land_8_20_14_0_20_55_17]PIW42522.1 MAG: hypothetical protein COW19_07540 [Zetaproteobacteria bacterium CG12_big_fil_rev_8_21_14_0_65_55_1124]